MNNVPAPTTAEIAAADPSVWRALMLCLFRTRRIEERLIRLYHQGRIFGGVYTGVGQEATGAAAAEAGGPDDLYAPLIRNLSVHLGRGESVLNVFRQWLARAAGPTRGRDGNVHFGNLQHGVYTMISHLGAMLPVVTGGIMARRRRGLDAVGVGFIGDGGTSTGDFHEAVNFAAVYDVPVLFLIENNHYAYSTPSRWQYRCEQLVDKAAGYGIEGYRADGNDAVGLYLLVRRLFAEMRERPRPMLLECDTMRMRGHGEHDDFSYVPKELLQQYAERDALHVARATLLGAGVLSEAAVDELDRTAMQEVEAGYQQALAEPPPDPAHLLEGIYAPG